MAMNPKHVCGTLQGWHANSRGVFSYRVALLFDGKRYRARCLELMETRSTRFLKTDHRDETGDDVACLDVLVERIKSSIDDESG